ncbi:dATP/dGTP diphosphohydrolase domain-containing protein [Hydrogenimonas sp.]
MTDSEMEKSKFGDRLAISEINVGADPNKVAENVINSAKRFMKDDREKAPMAILFDTTQALAGVANVMAYGAKKYNRKNWDKVDDPERYVSAAMRHMAAYCQGCHVDVESGLDHLDHAIASLMFLSEIEKRRRNVSG